MLLVDLLVLRSDPSIMICQGQTLSAKDLIDER